METNYLENNNAILFGKVANEKKFSHEIYGEKFYTFNLSVPRLSGNADIIPVTISERLFREDELVPDKKMKVEGQFRSYNNYEGEKNRLILTVFAKDVTFLSDDEEIVVSRDFISNEITLIGYICKPPIYRETPFGREITDLLMAVNRAYNKSDYIPCICWGRNARFSAKLPVGTEIKIIGRIQSRNYEKKLEDGRVEQRVAFEVSISNLELLDEEENEKESAQEADNIDDNKSVEAVQNIENTASENDSAQNNQ